MHTHKGFTLIELTIVVAIISILAAITTVVFQPYIVRAQLTAALADITPGKGKVEILINDDRPVSLVTPELIGGAQNAHCSVVEAELSESGVGHISCTLKGHSALEGKDLILRRSAEGIWSCDGSAFEARYRPTGC
ncbi:pilin [Stenotrophomonas indicatrix]|jgi:type IV pilus assembly protein PilA|uniref:pilin n=1 Tax=Stenotrophomonas TaxID=40323 RepID=UPI000C17C66E|nr:MULTISPECIES: pilin [Stenotrophomonas]MCO7471962.1 pilin [Stenotrophomonas maltophilia]MBA0097611.1 pilin [Stenotrophomonas indicatrix]MDF2483093.1 ppdD [Stenotrophomonas indicatrix]PII16931.1 prepilin-type cleavage/methylation domain-containing protein [Stenotrophomonas indicatrix]PII18928.1 prepilin-type cleavage/methylation domain-containing protein [Stenotrophomonas sp. LMG 10879]